MFVDDVFFLPDVPVHRVPTIAEAPKAAAPVIRRRSFAAAAQVSVDSIAPDRWTVAGARPNSETST